MIRILLTGAAGKMGRAVTELCRAEEGLTIVAGIDVNASPLAPSADYPIFPSFAECNVPADVIVDFSHHTALEGMLAYALTEQLPVVVATTGHTPEELAFMRRAEEHIAVFYSRNMSLGINVLIELVKKAAAALHGFDIEIIEKHHHRKLDAPSGTALMLADAAADAVEYTPEYVYSRQPYQRRRSPEEIGIHSVRGGTIVGEHDVIFAGHDEVITLSHSASSREIFAQGALRAAAYLIGKPAGEYDMSAMLSEIV